MVSTVFSKKQFTVLSVKKDELKNLINDLKGRNHLILYPCFTPENIEDVSDLIDEKMQTSILHEIETDYPGGKPKELIVKNWTGFKLKGVQSIECLSNGMFRIRSKEGSFMTDSFELFI